MPENPETVPRIAVPTDPTAPPVPDMSRYVDAALVPQEYPANTADKHLGRRELFAAVLGCTDEDQVYSRSVAYTQRSLITKDLLHAFNFPSDHPIMAGKRRHDWFVAERVDGHPGWRSVRPAKSADVEGHEILLGYLRDDPSKKP